MQWQRHEDLRSQSGEVEIALDRAMERIDSETLRAQRAEATLSEVDQGVDRVNERIADLESALTDLSKLANR